MHLCDLQTITELANIAILSSDDPRAEELMQTGRSREVAEAVDTFRLFDLLHRDEYEPLAIVQFGTASEGEVKVYFARLQCGNK